MKRVLCFFVTVIFVMSVLTSCIVIPQYKNFEIDPASVSSIEVYDLLDVDTFDGFFLETETSVYTIPEEDKAAFLDDLGEIEFSDAIIITIAAIDPSFYYDVWTVRINYTDGSYELISCDGYGATYNKNGEMTDTHHFGCDEEEWRTFVKKYIPKSVANRTQESM